MAKCRYCRSEIVWKTVNGIATPLDPELVSYDDGQRRAALRLPYSLST
jgi:hypothetical protein